MMSVETQVRSKTDVETAIDTCNLSCVLNLSLSRSGHYDMSYYYYYY